MDIEGNVIYLTNDEKKLLEKIPYDKGIILNNIVTGKSGAKVLVLGLRGGKRDDPKGPYIINVVSNF